MFDAIVCKDLPRRTARRGAYSLAASGFQAAVFASILFGSAHLAAREPPPLPVVQVQIIRSARQVPRRTYAPPAAAAALSAGRRAALARPGVRTYKPPPPSALLQPRTVPTEMRIPSADEPIEEIDPAAIGGDGDGVVGGFAGVMPASLGEPPAAAAQGDGIEEAPQWVTSGFRKPAEIEPGCVAAAIRLPSDIQGFVAQRVTVKFSVRRDGSIGQAEVLANLPDRRIEAAILRALASCRWRPGADARGEPIALWVILPIRFEGI